MNALEGKKRKNKKETAIGREKRRKKKKKPIPWYLNFTNFSKQSKVLTWISTPDIPLGAEELNVLF